MVTDIINKIRKSLMEFSGSGNQYSLLMLMPEQPHNMESQFGLLLSATWLNTLPYHETLKKLIELLRRKLSWEEYRKIENIYLVHTDDPIVKNMTRLYQVNNGLVNVSNIQMGETKIDHAIILDSAVQ